METQLMLFGSEIMRRSDVTGDVSYVEPELSVQDALDIATNYGVETARRYQVVGVVADKIRNFIGGLVAANGYDAAQAELLRNNAWAGAERSGALSELPF